MSDSDAYIVESDRSEEDFFDSDEEMDFEPAPKSKKAAPKNKRSAARSVLAPKDNALNTVAPEKKVPGKNKSVEEIYQKKTQLEHILLRPDTYSKSSSADLCISGFQGVSLSPTHSLCLSPSNSWLG